MNTATSKLSVSSENYYTVTLPSATKLGQGYVFICVCDSVHKGGGLPQCMLGYPSTREQTPQSSHPGAVHAGRYGQKAGGTHPTGMHSC